MVHRQALTAMIQAVNVDAWPLLLYGPAGSGKTCAAAVVAIAWDRESIFHAPKIFFASASWVIRALSMHENSRPLLNSLRDCSLVILDDIATRSATDAAADALLLILNLRARKPMIVTSNHGPKSLETAFGDARIASRLMAGAMIEFPDKDKRLDTARVTKA